MWGDVAAWAGIMIAGCIGAWGVLVSRRAAASSAEAVDIAKKAQALQLESRHVTWARGWDRELDGAWIRNTGTDPAHNVLFWADFEGFETRCSVRVPRLDSLQRLDMPLDEMAAKLRASAAAAAARDTSGLEHKPYARVAAWGVRWESASGVPSSQDLDLMFVPLD